MHNCPRNFKHDNIVLTWTSASDSGANFAHVRHTKPSKSAILQIFNECTIRRVWGKSITLWRILKLSAITSNFNQRKLKGTVGTNRLWLTSQHAHIIGHYNSQVTSKHFNSNLSGNTSTSRNNSVIQQCTLFLIRTTCLEICYTKRSRCLFYSHNTLRTLRFSVCCNGSFFPNSVGKCLLNKELLASVTLNINTAPKCGYKGRSINTHFFLLLFFLGGSSPVVQSAICLSFISVFILFVIYVLLKKWRRKAWKVRTVQAESMKTLEKI